MRVSSQSMSWQRGCPKARARNLDKVESTEFISKTAGLQWIGLQLLFLAWYIYSNDNLSISGKSHGPSHSPTSFLDMFEKLRVWRCCNFFARRLISIVLNEVPYPWCLRSYIVENCIYQSWCARRLFRIITSIGIHIVAIPDLTLFHGSILTLSTNACTVLAHKMIKRHNLHFFFIADLL